MPGMTRDISRTAAPRLLAALAATVAAGLVSRLYSIGWFLFDRSGVAVIAALDRAWLRRQSRHDGAMTQSEDRRGR